MREFEVNCINRPRNRFGHEHITHVGHVRNGWRMRCDQVIDRIESDVEAYYLVERTSGRRSYLGVVREPGKPPYLRARFNREWNDDLLALQRCGAACDLVS